MPPRTAIPTKVEFTGVRQVDQAQRNAAATSAALNASPVAPPAGSGRHLEGLQIGAGVTKTFVHGLGHRPKAWLVLRALGAAAQVYETARDETTLTLHSDSTADLTFDLWVT